MLQSQTMFKVITNMDAKVFEKQLAIIGFREHDITQTYCDIIHDDSNKRQPISKKYATRPCTIKSLISGSNKLTSKDGLWEMMSRYFCDTYMLETIIIDSPIKLERWITHHSDSRSSENLLDQTYIIKPANEFGGHGILATNNTKVCIDHCKEILNTFRLGSKRVKQVVVLSEYIEYPLLIQQKKMHIRAYFTAAIINGQLKTFVMDYGMVYIAVKKYAHYDYGNPDIHDTHGLSTTTDLMWPDALVAEYPTIEKTLLSQITKIFKGVTSKLYNKLEPYPECKNAYHTFGADLMIDVRNGTNCNCVDCALSNPNWRHNNTVKTEPCRFAVKLIEINRRPGYIFYTKKGKATFENRIFASIANSIIAPLFKKSTAGLAENHMVPLN